MLSTISGPHLRFRLRTVGDGTSTLIGSANLTAGDWIHAAATYDGALMRLYQDCALVGERAKTGAVASAPGVPVWIGSNPGGPHQAFDGRIDDVKLFDRALSEEEVCQEMGIALTAAPAAPAAVPTLGGGALLVLIGCLLGVGYTTGGRRTGS